MSRFSQPLTHLIHENLSVLATFAFSRAPLQALRENKFQGGWKYLDRALFTVSEQRAEKACVELASSSECLTTTRASLTFFDKRVATVSAEYCRQGSRWFTRSATGGKGWRAYVDPRYLKILAAIFLAAILLAVLSAAAG